MKHYLLVILLLLCILPCYSQQNTENTKSKFQLGVGLNVNTSWVTGFNRTVNSTYRHSEESLDDPKIGMGFMMLYFNYFVAPRFSVSLSPQFNSYGARIKLYETVYHELGTSNYNRIITERLNYFQVPVTFNYYLTSYLSLNAGIYASALLGATLNDPERRYCTEYDYDTFYPYHSSDIDQNYRDADLGVTAGIGIDLGRFKISASYIHGVLNISDIIDGSHYNRAVNLSLIFNFINRK